MAGTICKKLLCYLCTKCLFINNAAIWFSAHVSIHFKHLMCEFSWMNGFLLFCVSKISEIYIYFLLIKIIKMFLIDTFCHSLYFKVSLFGFKFKILRFVSKWKQIKFCLIFYTCCCFLFSPNQKVWHHFYNA